MQNFKQYLTEGGNVQINVGGKTFDAERMDLKKVSRQTMVKSIRTGLKAINAAFEKFSGLPLWDSSLINTGDFLSGSTKAFFDLSSIDDDEFVKYKPSVGDIDLMIDGNMATIAREFLDKTPHGAQFDTLKFIGYKASGDQWITLWETDFGQSVQIDLEHAEFIGGKPSPWSVFSHSSAWEDMQNGIKGVFQKQLFRSLAAKDSKDIIVLKGKKQVPKQVVSSDYTASTKGVRKRIQPILDNSGKQTYMDGLPVYTELPSKGAEYYTDFEIIFSILFSGAKPTPKEIQEMESFGGMIGLINRYLKSAEKQKVLDRFMEILFGKGAQNLYRSDKLRDFREKTTAVRVICKEFGISWKKYLPLIKQNYKNY